MQVGMASYVIFNPQSQASGPKIALVYAFTILPFTFIGPFISPLLDHFSRQRITIYCDISRIILAVLSCIVVGGGYSAGSGEILLIVVLLAALTINRLQLAALSAALPYAIEGDEYIEASALMPVIGPVAAIGGGLFAALIRIFGGSSLGANEADALIFLLAGILLVAAVTVTLGIKRIELGPAGIQADANQPEEAINGIISHIVSGMAGAMRNLWRHRPAFYSITIVFAARIIWGAMTVMAVLLYRHYFNNETTLEKAMVEMAIWFGVAGAGFALCGPLVTALTRRLGVRTSIIWLLLGSALAILLPLIAMTKTIMLVAGFLIGIFAQSIKACGDAVTQSHINDYWRGRVMVIYDIFNNLGIVVGALLAGYGLAADGYSNLAMLLMAFWFVTITAAFAALTRKDSASYNKGVKVDNAR